MAIRLLPILTLTLKFANQRERAAVTKKSLNNPEGILKMRAADLPGDDPTVKEEGLESKEMRT